MSGFLCSLHSYTIIGKYRNRQSSPCVFQKAIYIQVISICRFSCNLLSVIQVVCRYQVSLQHLYNPFLYDTWTVNLRKHYNIDFLLEYMPHHLSIHRAFGYNKEIELYTWFIYSGFNLPSGAFELAGAALVSIQLLE